MSRIRNFMMVSALAAALMSPPLNAQASDASTFLKAVKERDGGKATDLLMTPGSVVVNSKEPRTGDSALHIVVHDRDISWLGFLLGKRARPDIQNREGETPLAVAVQLGWAEGAQLLADIGANVDLPNSKGETPLIHAVRRKDLMLVRMLLAKGANPNRTDSVAGYSAIDYAKQDRTGRSAAILKLLEAPRTQAKKAAGPTR